MTSVLVPMGKTSSASASTAISKTGSAIGEVGGKISGGFGLGYTVGSTAVQSLTAPWLAYRSAKYEKRQLKMQADLYAMQAKAQHTAADDIWRAGHKQAAGIGFEAGQAKSSTRVSQAAAGIQVSGSGSAAEIMTSIDIAKEMQINDVMAAACANAWGYRRQAVNSENQAMAARATASSISPWANALATIASGALDILNGKDSQGNKVAGINDFKAFGSTIKEGMSSKSGFKVSEWMPKESPSEFMSKFNFSMK